jgi:adenine-specific DNA-methyltransferase
MDFFAGSGTTGDAVLQLNAEDGGNRRFILVTNNEDKICDEVTYPRLKKVIKGFKKSTGEKFDALGGELNFFRIKFLKKSLNSDEMKIRLLDNCVDLLCFREGIFEEIESKENSYKLFRRGENILGVYNSFDYSKLKKMKKDLDKFTGSSKKVYVFSFDNSGLNPNDFIGWNDIELEPIPQKILEIIGELNA